jgi:hypothetical protein
VAKIQDDFGTWGGGRVDLELARSDLKQARRKGLAPFQLLRAIAEDGDAGAVALWEQWERVSWNRRAITWSVGLKGHLGVDDMSDQELAEQTVGGDIVLMIPVEVWNRLVWRRGTVAAILSAAEANGRTGAASVVMAANTGPPT